MSATTKRKPGRPAGSGVYTVRRQIVLDPQLAEAWREMVQRIGGSESAHIRRAMVHYADHVREDLDAAPKS